MKVLKFIGLADCQKFEISKFPLFWSHINGKSSDQLELIWKKKILHWQNESIPKHTLARIAHKSSARILGVRAKMLPTTERNVARNFLLHVFCHSTPSTALIVFAPSRMMMCYVNQLTSYGQTIHLDFCFVDRHFSYFFIFSFCFVFVGSFNDLKE